jgi:hypothetical protein
MSKSPRGKRLDKYVTRLKQHYKEPQHLSGKETGENKPKDENENKEDASRAPSSEQDETEHGERMRRLEEEVAKLKAMEKFYKAELGNLRQEQALDADNSQHGMAAPSQDAEAGQKYQDAEVCGADSAARAQARAEDQQKGEEVQEENLGTDEPQKTTQASCNQLPKAESESETAEYAATGAAEHQSDEVHPPGELHAGPGQALSKADRWKLRASARAQPCAPDSSSLEAPDSEALSAQNASSTTPPPYQPGPGELTRGARTPECDLGDVEYRHLDHGDFKYVGWTTKHGVPHSDGSFLFAVSFWMVGEGRTEGKKRGV